MNHQFSMILSGTADGMNHRKDWMTPSKHRVLQVTLMGALLCIALLVAPAAAATITVAADGTGDYTSIRAAVDAAESGDTVYIRNGMYTEGIGSISISKDNIKLIGENVDKVIVNFQEYESIGIGASGCHVENIKFVPPFGYLTVESNSNIIRNNIFLGITSVKINTGSSYNLIENNVAMGTRSIPFLNFGSFNQIRNNWVSGCNGGIAVSGGGSSNLVENNTITNVAYSKSGVVPIVENAANNTIARNTIINNDRVGIQFNKNAETNRIYQNTVIGNRGTAGIRGSPSSPPQYWVSPEPLPYTYNDTGRSGILGNYWGSDYSGTDADADGIGDTAYTLPDGLGNDTAPLMGIWHDGTIYGGPDTIAPGAGFTVGTFSGQAPMTVTFTSWTPGPGTVTSYAWDFENDGIIDSTEANPTHTYATGGTYTVNLTVTGPGGSTSVVKSDLVTAAAADPDLTVSSVSTLYPYIHNNVTVTIVNAGTADAGAFKVNLTLDNTTTVFDIPSLAAGSTTTIGVIDEVHRKYGETPLKVVVDTENTVAESDETNNEYTNVTVATSGNYYHGGRYYTGNDLETSVYEEGHIGVVYSTAGIGYGGAGTVTYTPEHLPIPADAKILSARLYQSWTWYGYGTGDTVQFNGHESQDPVALYFDGIDGMNGQAVFDVTPYFVVGGDNTAVITGTSRVKYGPVLVVIYEEADEPYRQIWLDEGSDSLYSNVPVSTDPYIAYAMFRNATTTDLVSAKMTTILPSGDNDAQDRILFNNQSAARTGSGGTDPAFKYYDVKSALQDGTNELGVICDGYQNLAVAILEVTKETASNAGFAATPVSGPAPLTVRFNDT